MASTLQEVLKDLLSKYQKEKMIVERLIKQELGRIESASDELVELSARLNQIEEDLKKINSIL